MVVVRKIAANGLGEFFVHIYRGDGSVDEAGPFASGEAAVAEIVRQEREEFDSDQLIDAGVYMLDDFRPHVVDDMGCLVETGFDALAQFYCDQFASVPAAREFWGASDEPLPDLI